MLLLALSALLGLGLLGCAGPPRGEAEGRRFVRCAQRNPPAVAERVGALGLRVRDRVLTVSAAAPLRLAAFTGPVGGRLPELQLTRLRQARPALLLYLGGVGDDPTTAHANLTRLAALDAVTVFIPGGADLAAVVDDAFDALDDAARTRVLDGSGLRGLVLGKARFAVVAGAPLGRYARTDDACGASDADLAEVQSALDGPGAAPLLLSWQAPIGLGVSSGAGGSELGSPALAQLVRAIGARGGVFAYPEGRAGLGASAEAGLVVRRLGASGSRRTDGGFAAPGFSLLTVTAEGALGQP